MPQDRVDATHRKTNDNHIFSFLSAIHQMLHPLPQNPSYRKDQVTQVQADYGKYGLHYNPSPLIFQVVFAMHGHLLQHPKSPDRDDHKRPKVSWAPHSMKSLYPNQNENNECQRVFHNHLPFSHSLKPALLLCISMGFLQTIMLDFLQQNFLKFLLLNFLHSGLFAFYELLLFLMHLIKLYLHQHNPLICLYFVKLFLQ